jgi:hypothetical protein
MAEVDLQRQRDRSSRRNRHGIPAQGRTVWLSADGSSAYVISDERIERWPGAAEPIYCA